MKYILIIAILMASCTNTRPLRGVQVIGAGSQTCFKSKGKFKKAKAYHYRRSNPTMKHKF